MDPELVKEILVKKFGQFMKSTPTPLAEFLLRGLGSPDGEKRAKYRKIINPAFHLENLKLMLPAFSASCGDLIRKWDKMILDEGYLEADVFPELQDLTKDVISRIAFGSSYEKGRRIFQLITEKIQLLLQAIQSVSIPGYRLIKFLPTPMNKKISQVDKEMEGIIKGTIEKREKAMRMGESSKNDLLDILFESNMKECEEEHGKSRNRVMTTEYVLAECRLFYL
ncbi:putative secologanin synthase [Dioscorea sansibarensis]